MQKTKQKKKILILSCERGGKGHIVPALAVAQAIKKINKNINVKIIDIYDYLSLRESQAHNNSYIFMSKYFPPVIKIGFFLTDSKLSMKFLAYSHYPFYKKKLVNLYKKENPNLVLSDFPHWQYLSWLVWKKVYQSRKFVSLVTDFLKIHNGWTLGSINSYIVPSEQTAKVLEKRGIDKAKIKVFGIPVKLTFSESVNRSRILKKLNLDSAKPTVLFLPSAKSSIDIIKNICQEHLKINLIVVAGRNQQLLPKIKEFANKDTAVLGWTNKMPDLIKSSDIVITKAGGSTIAECLSVTKPTIIYQVIPGQEEGNAKFIIKNGLGIVETDFSKIPEKIRYILANQNSYQKRLNSYRQTDSAVKIAKYLLELI
ncbi:MAG: glycosyltransferase [bacterium]|nr:glycosyltransferase [bacterium]